MSLRTRRPPGLLTRIALLVFACALLTGLELFAEFFLKRDRLETILSVLKRDRELIWTMRPNLKTEFFGAEISTDAQGFRLNGSAFNERQVNSGSNAENPFRVITLGASPSFGWGVADHQTYSARLEGALKGKLPGRTSVSVLNASVIGYSSQQGRLLFEKNIHRWRPDLVIVAYGINDVDSYRFFSDDGASDKDIRKEPALVVSLNNFLSPFAIVAWMNRAIQRTASFGFGDARQPRVSEDDYIANIASIAEKAIGQKAHVLVLKMDLNLPRGDDPTDPEKAKLLIGTASQTIEQRDCARALPLLEEAARLDPLSKSAHLYSAKCHLDSGQIKQASMSFEKAEKTKAFLARRRSEKYNDALDTLSGRPGLTVVDLVERFSQENDYLYVDPRLDTIHPNARGHEIIAGEIEKRIVELWDK
jgi:lysophospholipase L1-like esterase